MWDSSSGAGQVRTLNPHFCRRGRRTAAGAVKAPPLSLQNNAQLRRRDMILKLSGLGELQALETSGQTSLRSEDVLLAQQTPPSRGERASDDELRA